MKAMVIERLADIGGGEGPLRLVELPVPAAGDDEILVRIRTCGVCHTELDEIEGRTPPPRLPVVPGHQVIGHVQACGREARRFRRGDRVGIGWIYSACGKCAFCSNGRENLCAEFLATGRDADGGYAEYMAVREDFAYPIPGAISDVEAAPLLCAGAIGFRSLRLCSPSDGDRIGLSGFGASAHLVLQMIRNLYPAAQVFVFSRTEREREFARELGAHWSGGFDDSCPRKLDCIIDTTPAWTPLVESLRNLERGGRLVINAIRKEDGDKDSLLRIDYAEHLWMEREVKSVANITRRDVEEFLEFAAHIHLRPEVQLYSLKDAGEALMDLKQRKIRGAKVLEIA